VNIKSTHLYVPLVEKLKREGIPAEIMFFSNVPNKQLRFYQVQADIVLDMLTYGFFGATAREAMMLGKPVICYLRPEWLESMRREIPEYVDELPIVRATPETVETKLRALIADPQQRERIGQRSRAFAVKWHSSAAGARRLGQIYSKLLCQDAFVR
jgi:glycosyltransferase involved in cell wall biosynthesis